MSLLKKFWQYSLAQKRYMSQLSYIVLTVLAGVESTKYNMFREAVFVLFFGWIGAIAEVLLLDANAKRVVMKTACMAMGMAGFQVLWSSRRVI